MRPQLSVTSFRPGKRCPRTGAVNSIVKMGGGGGGGAEAREAGGPLQR